MDRLSHRLPWAFLNLPHCAATSLRLNICYSFACVPGGCLDAFSVRCDEGKLHIENCRGRAGEAEDEPSTTDASGLPRASRLQDFMIFSCRYFDYRRSVRDTDVCVSCYHTS
jgi:hypothetical protein